MPKRTPLFLHWLSRFSNRSEPSPGLDWSGMAALIIGYMMFFLVFVLVLFVVSELGPFLLQQLRSAWT